MDGEVNPMKARRPLEARCQLAHVLAQQGDETRVRQAAAESCYKYMYTFETRGRE